MNENLPSVLVVAGPTSCGKSDFAVNLALKVNGEIVSVDSRQMYKGLDIGSGKITKDEMQGVPHHMLSVYDPHNEHISIATFQKDALKAIDDILSRGKIPILCGGSGQYLHALLYKQTFAHGGNTKERDELMEHSKEELKGMLSENLLHELNESDRENKVRLIRKILVERYGDQEQSLSQEPRFHFRIYLLTRNKEDLKARVELRMDKRLSEGMVEEVRNLKKEGISTKRLMFLGLEYGVIAQYLDGIYTYEIMRTLLKQKSWQYAKRQLTWNKKYLATKDTEIILLS